MIAQSSAGTRFYRFSISEARLWLRQNGLLVAIALLGFGLRAGLLSLLGANALIDNDGTSYARLAYNLRHGFGFTDVGGGPFPFPASIPREPLYGILILAVTTITGNEEFSGRIISIVAGAVLPIVVFSIGRCLFGRNCGLVAALIVATSPFLIELSVAVLGESLFLLLLFTALAFASRAVKSASGTDAAWAGILFGLAYLTRTEGIAVGVAVILTIGALLLRRGAPAGAAAAAVVAGTFALGIVASPYVVFVSHVYGRPAFEAESGMNGVIARALLHGATYEQAANAIAADGRPVGGELFADLRTIPATSFQERAFIAAHVAPIQAYNVIRTLLMKWVLTPLGLALACIGFARGWRGERRRREQVLLAVTVCVAWVALLSLAHFWGRYVTAFVPVFAIWAGKGAVDVYGLLWVRRYRRIPNRAEVASAMTCAVAIALVWAAAGGVETLREAPRAPLFERTAGEWLSSHVPGPKVVLSTFAYAPYYANARGVEMPYSRTVQPVFAFMKREGVNYLVLSDRPSEAEHAPYEIGWVDGGIGDPRAHLVWREHDRRTGETVAIYRWDASGS